MHRLQLQLPFFFVINADVSRHARHAHHAPFVDDPSVFPPKKK